MLGCSNTDCKIQWFHLDCIPDKNIPKKNQNKLPWYCSTKCKNAKQDKIFFYTTAMMNEAMGQRLRKISIQDNNGPLRFLLWKEDLVTFRNR